MFFGLAWHLYRSGQAAGFLSAVVLARAMRSIKRDHEWASRRGIPLCAFRYQEDPCSGEVRTWRKHQVELDLCYAHAVESAMSSRGFLPV